MIKLLCQTTIEGKGVSMEKTSYPSFPKELFLERLL